MAIFRKAIALFAGLLILAGPGVDASHAYELYKQATFPPYKSGLATVGYRLYNVDGSANGSRQTTGISERGTGSGIYGANVTFPDGFSGEIRWDTGDSSPLYASEAVNPSGIAENLDAKVSAPVTVGTNNDKSNYVLAPSGVDEVVVEPAVGMQSAVNLRQALSLIFCAAPGGIITGAGTSRIVVKNPAGTADRIQATVDAKGNRSSVTLTPP